MNLGTVMSFDRPDVRQFTARFDKKPVLQCMMPLAVGT